MKAAKTVILAMTAVAIFSSAALYAGSLPIGTSESRPGTTPALGSPFYTLGLPSYFIPANLVSTLSSPFVGGQTGTVTSNVYKNPADSNHLGFEYLYLDTGNTEVVRASFGPLAWAGVYISDAGADSTGASLAGTAAPKEG